jgi:hypothetical protein
MGEGGIEKRRAGLRDAKNLLRGGTENEVEYR